MPQYQLICNLSLTSQNGDLLLILFGGMNGHILGLREVLALHS